MNTLLKPLALALLVGSIVVASQTAKADVAAMFVSDNVFRAVSDDFIIIDRDGYDWDSVTWNQVYQATFEDSSDDHWTNYTREMISLTDHILGWYGTDANRGLTDIAQFLLNIPDDEIPDDEAGSEMDAIRVTFTLVQMGEWNETGDSFFVTDGNGNVLLNYSGLNNEESYSAQEFELIFPKSGNELQLFFQAFLENNEDGKKLWGINDFTIYQGKTDLMAITPAPASAVILGIGALTLCGTVFKRRKR